MFDAIPGTAPFMVEPCERGPSTGLAATARALNAVGMRLADHGRVVGLASKDLALAGSAGAQAALASASLVVLAAGILSTTGGLLAALAGLAGQNGETRQSQGAAAFTRRSDV